MALAGPDLFLVNRGGNDYKVSHTDLVASFQNTFSGATAPTNPQAGWIWYNTTTKHLNVHNGTSWDVVSGVTVADAAPAAAASVDGDLWYDTNDGRLYIYANDGSSTQWVDASPDNLPDLSAYSTTVQADAKYVDVAGDTMTGALTVPDATVNGTLLNALVPKSISRITFADKTTPSKPQTIGIPITVTGRAANLGTRAFVDVTHQVLNNRRVIATINEGTNINTGADTVTHVIFSDSPTSFTVQFDNLITNDPPALVLVIYGDL